MTARRFRGHEAGAISSVLLLAAAAAGGCDAEVGGTGAPAPASATTSIELVTATMPAAPGATGAISAAASAAASAAPVAGGPERFGAPLSGAPAVPLDEVMKAPEKYTSAPVKISAKIDTVCKKKGCWMTLAGESGPPATTVRVTFRDYGFFMPMDSAGARVTVEGTLTVTEESEATAKHYAEDEGRDPSTVKGPMKKIAIDATGVELVRAGS